MNEVSLTARKREETGKQVAKRLRREGKLPAVIYGGGEDPLSLELDYREFDAFVRKHRGENVLINLKIGRSKPKTAILRDIQHDYIKDGLIHAEFQQISLTDRLTATVAVVLIGEAPGTAPEFGGILEQSQRELMIQCIASEMPDHLEVDVSALQLGDSIHVRDLEFPDMDIVTDGDAVVASVAMPMREEVVEEEEEEGLEEPELIGREQDEEDGEEDEGGDSEES